MKNIYSVAALLSVCTLAQAYQDPEAAIRGRSKPVALRSLEQVHPQNTQEEFYGSDEDYGEDEANYGPESEEIEEVEEEE
jgi:hypothetical protein